LKGARAIRVMRLLRLAKLQRIVNIVFDKVQSEYMFIVINLLKLLLFVLVLNHLIACAWYGLAKAIGDKMPTNWILTAEMIDDPIIYKYLTSLHWSLTQFTPAGMDISARNSVERLFSIVVLFFAMIAFSSIVANITSSMSNLRNMKGDHVKQFWLLRRYLKQQSVNQDLSERIFRFLEHHLKSQAGSVHRNQLPVLANLSEALQNELKFHIMSKIFMTHDFFRQIGVEMQPMLHTLCSKMFCKTYAEQETIFTAGDAAKKTFFVRAGKIGYRPMHGLPVNANMHECIAEATLWVHWRHQGGFETVHVSELFDLSPDSFQHTMQLHPKPWFIALSYARDFLYYITHVKPSQFNDLIRDDSFPTESIVRICSSFPDKFNS